MSLDPANEKGVGMQVRGKPRCARAGREDSDRKADKASHLKGPEDYLVAS